MSGLEDDTKLIRDLCAFAKKPPSRIAAELGMAATTLTRPAAGKATTRIGRQTLEALRAAYPQFPGFSAEPDENDLDDLAYVQVLVLPSYAGAGGGGTGEGDRVLAKLPRRLIEDELRGRAADFELIDVRGDSMEPDFQHGDQILIDKRDRDPRQPGPFVVWDEDGYVVKLVERVPQKRGWYRIFSANPRYSAYEIEETESTIMGRPVWFARRL